ncbi:MAG: hypothetical protein R2771_01065 [Saprospiraceae bacterium]
MRYSLQDAGYIDYDSMNGNIIVNKSHLLIKPTDKGIVTFLSGARDNVLIEHIIKYCETYKIVLEIQDDIDFLHPQIIYVKFKESNINAVQKFACEFDLVFKKNGLHTQFALASFFPDIADWECFIQEIKNEIKDFPGGLIFDIDELQFKAKSEKFDENLSFIKYSNISGFKTVYRFWYEGKVYSIEDQQLGVYLYLYLYKMQAYKNYNKCVEESGKQNCRKEQNSFEEAKTKTNIILYDKKKKYLAVPINCRLPRNLSISVALLNGQKPEIKHLNGKNFRKGLYIIYKNVPSLFLTNTINLHLLKKELQSLNETTINIEL